MEELPLKYTALSKSNLSIGMEFGPVNFFVNKSSHEKSKNLLEGNDIKGETKIISPYLFPSEMWGWARVFSSYFGRLNEVAVSRANWKIYEVARPDEKLISKSKVVNVESRNNLSFATAETVTQNENGNILIKTLDELLLLHDVNFKFYKERNNEKEISKNNSYTRSRKVYFRYNWNSGKWMNNIHTDAYAKQFGYEGGLPEFIMYMDWIFMSELETKGKEAYQTTIELEKILPIYEGEIIKIIKPKNSENNLIQFFRENQERVRAHINKQN